MAGYRPSYSAEEEKKMLRYVEENEAHDRLRGDALYKDMALWLQNGRTWHSLKNHMTKHLLQRIEMPCYELTQEQIQTFKQKFKETAKPLTVSQRYRYQSRHVSNNLDSEQEVPQTSQRRRSFDLANTRMSSSDEEEPDNTQLPNERSCYVIEPDSDPVFEISSESSGSTTDCEGHTSNYY